MSNFEVLDDKIMVQENHLQNIKRDVKKLKENDIGTQWDIDILYTRIQILWIVIFLLIIGWGVLAYQIFAK